MPSSGKHSSPSSGKRKRGIVPLIVLLVVLLAAAAAGIAYLVQAQQQMDAALQNQEAASTPEEQPVEEELVENPIDFAELKQKNSEIYAWVYVPNTKVNLPILQSTSDDNYYLTHDEDGNESVAGAIFTQSMNSTDFTDPVTVIYGHNMNNGSMFATLHKFEDADFFEDNDTFYIYTPEKILTYRIVSAYQYDNRHILNSYDFSKKKVRKKYFAYVADPDSMVVNTRDVKLSASDRIVQLSTCRNGIYNIRYLVTGVLVNEQQTY